MIEITATKICKTCGRELPVEKFGLCNGGKYRGTSCNQCKYKKQKAKSLENYAEIENDNRCEKTEPVIISSEKKKPNIEYLISTIELSVL